MLNKYARPNPNFKRQVARTTGEGAIPAKGHLGLISAKPLLIDLSALYTSLLWNNRSLKLDGGTCQTTADDAFAYQFLCSASPKHNNVQGYAMPRILRGVFQLTYLRDLLLGLFCFPLPPRAQETSPRCSFGLSPKRKAVHSQVLL